MGFNWGGFSGGLASGLNTGIALGSKFNDAMKEHKVNQVREAAVQEARDLQIAEQTAKVKDNGAQGQSQAAAQGPAAAPVNTYQVDMGPTAGMPQQLAPRPAPIAGMAGMPQPGADPTAPPDMRPEPTPDARMAASMGIAPQQRFSVGAQGFDTRADAEGAATKSSPTLKARTRDLVAERLEQHFVETGDIESAEKWGKWRKQKENEVKMDTWAAGRQKAQAGDYMGAAKDFIKLYGDYKDGTDVLSAKPYKNERGQEEGFEMVIKGPDGERTQRMNAREIIALGETGLNPQAIWMQDMKEQQAADAARAKAAADKASDTRDLNKAVTIAEIREGRADRRTVATEEARNQRETGKAAQRKEEIKLKAKLRQEAGVREVRDVGLAPHPQKIAMQVEKDLKDDRTKYTVKGAPAEGMRFDQMSEAQRDELVQRKVQKKLDTYTIKPKAAATKPGKSYQDAMLWDDDEEEDD